MLGSYGLLGIFVYGERTAGPTHHHHLPHLPPPPAPLMLSPFILKSPGFSEGKGRTTNPPGGGAVSVSGSLEEGAGLGITPLFPSSPNTSHISRDELSSQKPLLLLIKALYIFFVLFFFLFFSPVFTHSFDKRSMLLLYYFSTGVHHHFHASIIPSVVFIPFFMFFPQTFYVKQKSSYFCIFISCGKADCQLFVSPLKGFTLSSWVCSLSLHQVMNRWAVMDVRGSSFQFLMTKKKCKGKRTEELFSCFLSPLVSFRSFDFILFFSVVCLKTESPDGCKAKNHKYWVPSFGELNVLSSVKSLAQRQHYLVVLVLFVTI